MIVCNIWCVLFISFAIFCSLRNFSSTLFPELLMNCCSANSLALLKLTWHTFVPSWFYASCLWVSFRVLMRLWGYQASWLLIKSHTETWTTYPSAHFSATFLLTEDKERCLRRGPFFLSSSFIFSSNSLQKSALLLCPLYYFSLSLSQLFLLLIRSNRNDTQLSIPEPRRQEEVIFFF